MPSNTAAVRYLRHGRRRKRDNLLIIPALFLGTFVAAAVSFNWPNRELSSKGISKDTAGASELYTQSFTVCSVGPRINCVVDGDTFWLNSRKIRIADIDTPEIHPSHCAHEERLGQAAKQRLLVLLNIGPFELVSGQRDQDIYGRALRVVSRDGISLGGILVGEGLARSWDGHRHPWCG